MIGWLLAAAIHRIIERDYEIEGDYMLIVSILGFISNLIMGQILYSAGGLMVIHMGEDMGIVMEEDLN